MAYIKPEQNIFFANGGRAITATITKIAFRKYWAKPYKDKKTGKMVKKQKSMPFACVCRTPCMLIGPRICAAAHACILQLAGPRAHASTSLRVHAPSDRFAFSVRASHNHQTRLEKEVRYSSWKRSNVHAYLKFSDPVT